jgi:hypothetical protein
VKATAPLPALLFLLPAQFSITRSVFYYQISTGTCGLFNAGFLSPAYAVSTRTFLFGNIGLFYKLSLFIVPFTVDILLLDFRAAGHLAFICFAGKIRPTEREKKNYCDLGLPALKI